MLGEYFPLVHHLHTHRKHRPLHIVLYKMQKNCPLNVFYAELQQALDGVTISLHSDMTRIQHNYTALQPLDNITRANLKHHKRQLLETVRFLRETAIARYGAPTSSPHASVHVRNDTDTSLRKYYDTHYADKYGEAQPYMQTSGAQRRKVTNMPAVVDALKTRLNKPVRVIHSRPHEPFLQQLHHYLSTDLYVLEHGAAMVFALFVRPSSTVIELIPRKKQQAKHPAVQSLQWIAALYEHTLHRVTVPDKIAPVSVKAVMQCV